MASAAATLGASVTLARPSHLQLWPDGPIWWRRRKDGDPEPELMALEISLEDLPYLVAEVESAAAATEQAAQWLRRLAYSGDLGSVGDKFDRLRATDDSRAGQP